MADKKNDSILTADNLRDLGMKNVLKPSHEGPLGRPTEEIVELREEKGKPRTRPQVESPMNNPGFGRLSGGSK